MKKITKEDAIKTASLSGIELSEKEAEAMAEDLTKILDYFDEISEIDTEDVEPTYNVVDIKNVYRDDEAGKSIPPELVVKNAPQKFGSFILVPQIIEDEKEKIL
jgi:aspartyl-tRNA(Asn)/glutamyl-tRNA(Gln) amidotransferase subunit C